MADFVNTIDVLGDDAVIDGIIDRTITEFKDDKVNIIGYGAFNGCKSLVTVNLPNVTTTKGMTFTDCYALVEVNLPLLTSISDQMLRNCKSLKTISLPGLTGSTGYLGFGDNPLLENVNIPLATEVGTYSFQGCPALKQIDLPSVKKICAGGLQCHNLVTIVLRYNGVCTLENTNAIGNKILNGNGYIYVPTALVDSYKAAANWSTYANQFRNLEEWTVDGTVTGELDIENRHMVRFFNSDGTLLGYQIVATGGTATYTGTPVNPDNADAEFKGFEPDPTNVTADMDCYAQYAGTWADVFASIANGTYKTKYAIGDTLPLDLGTQGVVDMEIVAFDTDDLADGSGKAPITWISKGLLKTKKRWNPLNAGTVGTGCYGGWESSEIRAYLNETIKPLIPVAVRNAIKEVTKTHMAVSTSGSNVAQTTNDAVWLPSEYEVFGTATKAENETGIYYSDKFIDATARKKTEFGSTSYYINYWLRSSAGASWPVYVTKNGTVTEAQSSSEYGVCLCFCT